jgi:hypothetical protein
MEGTIDNIQGVTKTIHDFHCFIDYLEANRIALTKTNEYMSRKDLYAINGQMTEPEKKVTKNSDQPAYPLLHLFYHLILAAELYVKESNQGGKLILRSTERLVLFQGLSPTEQYVSLLETLWVDLDWQKINPRKFSNSPEYTYEIVWKELCKLPIGEEISLSDHRLAQLHRFLHDWKHLLLCFSFFGFWKISDQRDLNEVEAYTIILTPLFKNVGHTLVKTRDLHHWNLPLRRKQGDWKKVPGAPLIEEQNVRKIKSEEWFYETLVKLFPKGELEGTMPRDVRSYVGGTYAFKVSLRPSCWRRIQLTANHTLLDLHKMIQKAFHFNDDHLYSFFMDAQKWSHDSFNSQDGQEPPFVDEVKIGELGLKAGRRFLYLFDFGDEWEFHVEVESILEGKNEPLKPQIVEVYGTAPEQYRF